MRLLYEKLLEKKMNSFRITNPNIICGRIANPPERRENDYEEYCYISFACECCYYFFSSTTHESTY